MNVYEEEIQGREFDWFVEDIDGNIGVFASAGEGFLPASVLEHYQEHDEVQESIDTPRVGTHEVWSDYSEVGLYVYDWDLPGGPYRRERIPESDMPLQLRKRILAITGIPKFKVRFSDLIEMIDCKPYV